MAIGTCYLASTLYIMATLLTLEQHASNFNHLEADMLPELRTAKIVRDFRLQLKNLYFTVLTLPKSTATSGNIQQCAKKEN